MRHIRTSAISNKRRRPETRDLARDSAGPPSPVPGFPPVSPPTATIIDTTSWTPTDSTKSPSPATGAAVPDLLNVDVQVDIVPQDGYPSIMKTARPYRSHKYPACARCHKRRSRCTIEVPGQACLLCRMHGVPCSSATAKKDDRVTPKIGFVHRSLITDEKTLEGFSHIVGPVIARDTQILDQYLPQTDGTSGHVPIQPNIGRRDSQKPIYRVPIPPRRPSPTECHCARNMPDELLDQVSPFIDKLLANYYEHFHPCYPVTEEECIMSRCKDRNQLPQTFFVNLVAYALFYWDASPALSGYARPDQDFAWQTAVAANITDMQKGDLGTIVSICIDIAGRPSRCLVKNVADVARAVALSHAIGLNHDCSEWKISDMEKRLRWRAWWAVVIQDRWFNFAQGTPPYISKGHYDVPLPTVELLTQGRGGSVKHARAADVYIHLCRLTEIVGDVLPLIYHIRSGNDSIAAEQTSRSEIELNRWMESRPSWLNLNDFHNRPPVPGLVNLQLSYLSVRMLLRRIAWHEISQRESDPASSWLLGCQAAAEDIVRFATSLQKHDLAGFWLPYNAHHFTSAVTLLLRCALQTSYSNVRTQCMSSARTLVDCLRKHHEEHQWDLAETALAQSETVLKRIEESLPKTPMARTPNENTISMHHDHMDTRGYGGEDHHLGDPLPEEAFFTQQGSIEELFPEIFSDFSDTALFGGSIRSEYTV
ncbi:putative C6 transcription factor [Cladophialophora carrionii]|uniref:Putative C6 transcription factor n=1 Tax=Cladophialophora carrionii TaxID=86049 RepID=A0A1C1CBC2_9EURO|nr:putative C6 transcription factor [Cladophialophora carrionii]